MQTAAWVRLAMTSALLAISGVLTVAASAQRWGCRIGVFDDANSECWLREDHLYDYISPRDPWVPIGAAAELHGVGMLIFATAVLLLPAVLTGRRPTWMSTFAAVAISASVALVALPTLLSGLEGEVVSLPNMWLPAVLYVFGLPALLILSAVRATPGEQRVPGARAVVVFCLIVANNFAVANYMVAPVIFMYASWDTNPWAETIGGVLLVCASAFLVLTVQRASPTHEKGAEVGDPLTTP